MRFPGGEVLIGYGYDAWGFLGAALLAVGHGFLPVCFAPASGGSCQGKMR